MGTAYLAGDYGLLTPAPGGSEDLAQAVATLGACDAAALALPDQIIRIVVADDHRILREALVKVLEAHADLKVVGQAWDGAMAVELAVSLRPHVVLMDVNMPRLNGIDATRQIMTRVTGVRVLGLSSHNELSAAGAMRSAGAEAFLPKGCSIALLLATIRGQSPSPEVSAGGSANSDGN
ncbi:MAG: response regulator transcription factor [Phycisphaeraceae bacterium]